MNFKLFLLLLLFSLSTALFAQSARDVKGILQDTTGAPVFGVTVKLISWNTSAADTLMTRSDVDGNFIFRGVKALNFNILASSLGYIPANISYTNLSGAGPIILSKIVLKTGSNMLEEIIVNGTPAVTMKQDTIEFRMADLKLKEGALVEDAIKRLDGTDLIKTGM